MSQRLAEWPGRTAHPRLAVLVAVGALLAVAGFGVAVAGPTVGFDPGLLGLRIGIVGLFLLFLGASGWMAFAVFDRGFD